MGDMRASVAPAWPLVVAVVSAAVVVVGPELWPRPALAARPLFPPLRARKVACPDLDHRAAPGLAIAAWAGEPCALARLAERAAARTELRLAYHLERAALRGGAEVSACELFELGLGGPADPRLAVACYERGERYTRGALVALNGVAGRRDLVRAEALLDAVSKDAESLTEQEGGVAAAIRDLVSAETASPARKRYRYCDLAMEHGSWHEGGACDFEAMLVRGAEVERARDHLRARAGRELAALEEAFQALLKAEQDRAYHAFIGAGSVGGANEGLIRTTIRMARQHGQLLHALVDGQLPAPITAAALRKLEERLAAAQRRDARYGKDTMHALVGGDASDREYAKRIRDEAKTYLATLEPSRRAERALRDAWRALARTCPAGAGLSEDELRLRLDAALLRHHLAR